MWQDGDMLKDLDAWIADLRGHRDRLAAELARVDAALGALAGDTATSPTPSRETGASPSPMTDLLGDLFKQQPDKGFSAETALEALRATGWESDATDPVNAMRTALSRMVKRGEVYRVGRGIYRKNREPSSWRDTVEDGQVSFGPDVLGEQREVSVDDF